LTNPYNLLVENQRSGEIIKTYCFNFFETLEAFPTLLSRIGLENPLDLSKTHIIAKSVEGVHFKTRAEEFYYHPRTAFVKEKIVLANENVLIELAEANNVTTTPERYKVVLFHNELPFDLLFFQAGALAFDFPKKEKKKYVIQPL
jgi:hypothetical protein